MCAKAVNMTDPMMRLVFINPETGRGWVEGDVYFRPHLARTLERLAEAGDKGDELFYRGDMGRELVKDLADIGGIITEGDMADYTPAWAPPVTVR